ncbi:hypothetical protein QR680_003994 [Steinernema hermaphroditum]|uniref:Uncharacterized protein n=1 Tax=Steinernema hermaphroditum TaxID=289476 RepID=A0AA39LSY7_9BILA|nr:hypothetical protein QR680_003994 [Steinernema hermaphroditum]
MAPPESNSSSPTLGQRVVNRLLVGLPPLILLLLVNALYGPGIDVQTTGTWIAFVTSSLVLHAVVDGFQTPERSGNCG